MLVLSAVVVLASSRHKPPLVTAVSIAPEHLISAVHSQPRQHLQRRTKSHLSRCELAAINSTQLDATQAIGGTQVRRVPITRFTMAFYGIGAFDNLV